MSKFKSYISETTDELVNKVSWPTWSELQSSAIVVMVASVIIALVVFAMDFTFNKGMEAIYNLF
ncbi:MAG TPA: preprotein translocase subunit SecE [Bacteroidia bacterium]|jgi:preprotein translocase subunit SecE